MFHYLNKCNRYKGLLTNRIRGGFPVLFLIAAIAALLLGTSSCYTLLKHPRVAQTEYEHDENMDSGCLSCHDYYAIYPPAPRPPRLPPWWLDHEWGNELETVPIREGLRPTPGRIDDDPPIKMPLDPGGGIRIQPGDPMKKKEDSGTGKEKEKVEENKSKERTLRPKKERKKKEDG